MRKRARASAGRTGNNRRLSQESPTSTAGHLARFISYLFVLVYVSQALSAKAQPDVQA
ncbi:MAG: hypothetical protein IMW89_18085 [Ktedonobacteraceae bacterium]|nr:hypothetical protein [Ktedonobacteraceae bacterium]